eukprot:3667742-Amphidinium_carterae.1
MSLDAAPEPEAAGATPDLPVPLPFFFPCLFWLPLSFKFLCLFRLFLSTNHLCPWGHRLRPPERPRLQ